MDAGGVRVRAGFLVLAACLAGAWTAVAESDVLERPALPSARAPNAVLLAVVRADGRLVAAGERGVIVYSDDDGSTWAQAEVPVSVSLTNLYFVTATKGWAVGHSGVVLHTEDRGHTWAKQLDGRQAARLVLRAAEARAAEGPRHAARQLAEARRLVDDGPDKPFLDVYFADTQRGFVVGAYGLFFATEDGGKTWRPWQDHLHNPNGKHLYSMRPAGRHLYVAGEQGALYRSADRGRTFVELATPYAGTYFGLLAETAGRLIAYGLRGNCYASNDAGRSWARLEIGERVSLTAGVVLDDGAVILVNQAGSVLRSTNHGQSFQRLPISRLFPLTGVVQAKDGSLILTGARGIARLPLDAVAFAPRADERVHRSSSRGSR